MVATVKEWRAAHAFPLILPECGLEVLIRPMDAWFFFKTNRIPNFLAGTVQALIEGTLNRVEMPKELDADKTREFYTWLDELIKFTFVEPKVVDEPKGEDELGVGEIGLVDKLFIYHLFGQPASLLRSFRQRQSEPVASVAVQKTNGRSAKSPAKSAAAGEPDTQPASAGTN